MLLAPPGYYQDAMRALTLFHSHTTAAGQTLLLWIAVIVLAVFWVIAIWMHLTGGLVTFGLGVCLLITIVVRLWLPRRRRQTDRRTS
jgi:ABC-type uncharacterized transport system permease subunit